MIADDKGVVLGGPNVPLIVYHSNCPDGWGSAYWLGTHLGPHEKWAANYDDALLPQWDGRDVYMLDFCYPGWVVNQMVRDAASLRILDHHATALGILSDEVYDLPLSESFDDFIHGWGVNDRRMPSYAILDQTHSGIGLTARYVQARWEVPPPAWFAHIEDRDLWRFALPDTEAVFAKITSHPYTVGAWDELAATPMQTIITEGVGIERYRQKLIDSIVETKHEIVIGTDVVWACAAPYAVGSDVAHELCLLDTTRPFAAYYIVNDLGHDERDLGRTTKLRFGLRSLPVVGADVSVIAKQMNPLGGGHVHASGFSIEL